MSDPFQAQPTLQQLARKVINLHVELKQLTEAVGVTFTQHDINLQQATEITDTVLEELNRKITFLMNMLAIKTPARGGLADASGQVQYEAKTALQVYMESGRAKLIEQEEERTRAQGLSTESAEPAKSASNGEAHDIEVSIDLPSSDTTH